MEIDYTIYLVRDTHGHQDYAVALDGADTIQICGMKDADSQPLYFESEVYHLSSWCNDNDLQFHSFKEQRDFDTVWKSLS